jgi:hypothetical protein
LGELEQLGMNCEHVFFTPTALRNIAQGCRAAATLGEIRNTSLYPNGVVPWRDDNLRNPFGVDEDLLLQYPG